MQDQSGDEKARPPKLTRRRWLKLAAAGAVAGSVGIVDTFAVRVTRQDVWLERLPAGWDGVRVLHISDFHRGPFVPAAYLRHAVARARALPHDMACLTGDFVSRSAAYMSDVLPMFENWTAPLGVWACLGNHDYYTDPNGIARSLEQIGIPVLRNTKLRLTRNGDSIWFLGLDDPSTSHEDWKGTLRGTSTEDFRFMIAHSPEYGYAAARDKLDFMLAGHTHGGQVCLPGGRAVIVANTMGPKYASGLFRIRDFTFFVTRGLGLVEVPFRTFCPPEIALLTLRRGRAA